MTASSELVLEPPASAQRLRNGASSDRSVLKRNTDEIALPPDHAAFADVVKVIEGQFEIQGQQVEVVEFNSSPGIRDILNAAGEDTAPSVKEQQRAFRNRRPCDRSAVEFHLGYQRFTQPWQTKANGLPPGGNQVRPFS
jgi:hypothetical protein